MKEYVMIERKKRRIVENLFQKGVMLMIAEIAREKLEKIKEKLDSGVVHSMVRRIGYQKVTVMGGKDGKSYLPTLTGSLGKTDLNIDFTHCPGGGYIIDIEAKVRCPFKLVLTYENVETKSGKFRSSSPIPIQEIEIGVKEFDDTFFIETLEEKPVREFLGSEESRKSISDLGQFDRLVFQYKYLKILYYQEKLEDLDPEWVVDKIKMLSQIGENLAKLVKK